VSATISPTTTHPHAASDANDVVLSVEGLRVRFDGHEGSVHAVDGVSFQLRRGRITALVGESGCGKSVTSSAILRLIQSPGTIDGGRIMFHPKGEPAIDITGLRPHSDALYHLRGGRISMIFQEPMTALSPLHTVGNQIIEAIRLHQPLSKAQARAKAIDMLGRVGIPAPQRRIDNYPFELSGGMRQRVVIAMALVCDPQVLIADEPTTALDVTIQAQIMRLMKGLQHDTGTSILLITHDLGVVAQMADDVAVMYTGRIVETGTVRQVLKAPRHPYTRGLLKSLPSLAMHGKALDAIEGQVPSLHAIPPGCPFHPRCEFAEPGRCDVDGPPELSTLTVQGSAPDQRAACVRVDEVPPFRAVSGGQP